MKTLRLFAITWLCSFISMFPALAIKLDVWASEIGRQRFQEFFTTVDFAVLAFYSFGTIGLFFVIIHLPGLALLRRMLHGVSPRWPFPVAAVSMGLLTCVVGRIILPHHPQAPFITPDMAVLCWMLAISGLVSGLGFARIHGHDAVPLTKAL